MTTGWHTITSVSLQASSLSLIFKAHTNLLSCIVSISTNDLDGHFTNGTFLQPLRDHDYMFTLLQHVMSHFGLHAHMETMFKTSSHYLKGGVLAQTAKFAIYCALPYIPNPASHSSCLQWVARACVVLHFLRLVDRKLGAVDWNQLQKFLVQWDRSSIIKYGYCKASLTDIYAQVSTCTFKLSLWFCDMHINGNNVVHVVMVS